MSNGLEGSRAVDSSELLLPVGTALATAAAQLTSLHNLPVNLRGDRKSGCHVAAQTQTQSCSSPQSCRDSQKLHIILVGPCSPHSSDLKQSEQRNNRRKESFPHGKAEVFLNRATAAVIKTIEY